VIAGLVVIACSGDTGPPTTIERPPSPPPVASVEIQPSSLTIVWGQQLGLRAVAKDASGRELTDRDVVWASSDPTHVTVTPSTSETLWAILNAVGPGTATITATIEGKSGQSAVTVSLPAGLFAWPDTSRIPVSATRRLTLRTTSGHRIAGTAFAALSWETTDPSVATVGADGQVTAVGVGHATITATIEDRRFTAEVFTFRYPEPLQFASVSSSGDHTCALTTAGVAYCWGLNDVGQLGSDAVMDRCAKLQTAAGFVVKVTKMRCSEAPVPVNTNLRFTSVHVGLGMTCALTASGAAYCWGTNAFGESGTGLSDAIVRVPTPVAGGITFRMLDVADFNACGVSTQNVAYCWGFNLGGALGNGSEASSPTPAQVAGNLSWRSVSAGFTACGVTTAGVAYCWGSNRLGTAGVPPSTQSCRNDAPCSTTPVRVAGDLTFSRVESALTLTCGLIADGSVYCWGEQAGPARTTTHVPTLVPGDLRFASLHVRGGPCALTADGATYCWGVGATTVDGQGVPFTATPIRSIPAFPLRALDLGGVRCGIDASSILYCWGTAASTLDQFWTTWPGWSVGSSTPVRVAGQQ
jgi:alpha-tubulin suppressor-like RCC1 family protein